MLRIAIVVATLLVPIPFALSVSDAGPEEHPVPPASAWLLAADTGAPLGWTLGATSLLLRVGRDTTLFPSLPPGVTLLAGTVEGQPGSSVAVSIAGERIDGTVYAPQFDLLHLTGDGTIGNVAIRESELLAWRSATGQPVPEHVDAAGPCLATHHPVAAPETPATPWPRRTLDLALTYDPYARATWGGDEGAEQNMTHLVAALDAFYGATVKIDIRIVNIHPHLIDIPEDHAEQFQWLSAHYTADHASLLAQTDAVHLFTKRAAAELGKAMCIGAIGNDSVAFSLSLAEANVPRQKPLPWEMIDAPKKVFAHEIGHLFSALHEQGNCAEGVDLWDAPAAAPPYVCTIMAHPVLFQTLHWSQANLHSVRGWADAYDV